MLRKTTLTWSLCLLLASAPLAFASFDMESCEWGDATCLLKGEPVLAPDNDSRDNLLRLLGEEKSFPLPIQAIPDDVSRTRDVYFAFHPEWDALPSPPGASPVQIDMDTLARQMAALNIDPAQFSQSGNAERSGRSDDEMKNRFVSYTLNAVSQFNAALLADPSLTLQQRHLLALARIKLFYGGEINALSATLNDFPADSTARLFSHYLSGVAHFYRGDYPAAAQEFTLLQEGKQPWLAETAQYMLMRTALNRSTQHSVGPYGDFHIQYIDKDAASQAKDAAHAYLQRWPEGRYADSARGMLRRIHWYLQDWPTLAGLYEQAFRQAGDVQTLRERITEYDNVVGVQFLEQSAEGAFADVPVVSYIELLRAIRLNQDNKPALTQAQLDASKPVFEKSGKLPLWRNLQLNLWMAQDNVDAVVQAVSPVTTLPENNLLVFSEQVLYGEALMAQQQWTAARGFWQKLLALSHDKEQQQYVQAKLAATLVYSGDAAAIFAADSGVSNLRYRSQVLKTVATPELLRQQVTTGPNNQERTIALHTLLVRDLTEGRFSDWLNDKKRVSTLLPPVTGKAFDDVNLSAFDWNGDATEAGYVCRSLDETVQALNRNSDDAHALNCLGEFFRTTQTHVDIWQDRAGNGGLEAALARGKPFGQYDRQSYYQQVITSPKAEYEDRSYALYRAVMCYAPSGYNECGGQQVDKLQRKGWFTQLKTQYPGSPWAQKLKYYW